MPRLTRPLVLNGILLLLLVGVAGPVADRVGSDRDPQALAARAVADAPLAFRSDGASGFVARSPVYAVAVSAGGATVSGSAGSPPLRMRLDGARAEAPAAGRVPLAGRVNLFLGDDPSQWRTDVATYGQATYRGVWDGIDVVWHGKGPHLEQDFVVAPGADPGQIGVSFPDGRDLSLTREGDLIVDLAAGRARFGAPVLYQEVGGRKRPVPGSFELRGQGQVGFRVGPHDPARELVIDPVLVESTYLGGGGNDAAYGVAVDGAGSVYVTGSTESPDFPVTGSVQTSLVQTEGRRSDAFVAKLNADGSGFAYSTFLGGGGRDIGYAIALGVDGSAYVSGSTESTDFPLSRPVQQAYGGGGTDAFVTKLGPQGAVLLYSTYLGGGGADGARGIAVDPPGNAYVTGTTTSNDFPTAGPPLQGTPSRPDDTAAFVTKVDPDGRSLLYSTYLGGTGDDHGTAIAVSLAGDAYVVGDTRSSDFPISRGFQPRAGTPADAATVAPDAFVVKLPATGTSLVYSTYLGGFESDLATGVAVDPSGAAYVTGSTGSSNFPLLNAVQINKRGDFDAFVTKLNPGGSGLVYSTFLGGSDSEAGAGITLAGDGAASITGSAASGDFPTVKPFQAAKGGGFIEGFVATYSPSGTAVLHASFVGGRDDDQGTAIASDGSDTLYVAGYTGSPDFPVARPLRPTPGGAGDAFVATVGEPAVGASTEPSGAPARDLRLRIFGAVTAVLFLAAIGQTLYLRRRPAPDEPPATTTPAPVPVGAASGTPSDPWYTQPAPKFSDLPPLRPRAVPTSRRFDGTTAADPAASTDGDVAVPDLLPAGEEQEWKREGAPGDTEFWTRDAPAPESDVVLPPVDVQAPDLW
ncbi:MAG: SBBP repeat-containing protein, partial [Acidimicrobiia bacterium]|nr:SBBP repeat-containing protein [Acidimicrobiia bacterium]